MANRGVAIWRRYRAWPPEGVAVGALGETTGAWPLGAWPGSPASCSLRGSKLQAPHSGLSWDTWKKGRKSPHFFPPRRTTAGSRKSMTEWGKNRKLNETNERR